MHLDNLYNIKKLFEQIILIYSIKTISKNKIIKYQKFNIKNLQQF